MGFKYSCFISYVHSGIPPTGSALMRQFVDEFEGLLKEELDTQVDEPIFRDNEELSGGDVLNPALGEALCASAAWIVVYVPRYPKREYCRREFTAMQLLERQRLQALNGALPPHESMIIPVVLRGDNVALPPAEAGERIYEDFKAYDSASNKLRRNEQYAKRVRAIAERVARLCELGNSLGDVIGRCGQFELPPAPSLEEWVPPPTAVFPGR